MQDTNLKTFRASNWEHNKADIELRKIILPTGNTYKAYWVSSDTEVLVVRPDGDREYLPQAHKPDLWAWLEKNTLDLRKT